jgi:pyrroline-5-carboxylate reductase
VLAQQQGANVTLLELLGDVCVAGGSTEKAIRTLDRLGTSDAVQAAVDTSWFANCAMGKEEAKVPFKG